MKKLISLILILFSLFIVSGNVSFAADNDNCGKSVGLTTVGIDILSDPTGKNCPDLSSASNSSNLLADTVAKKVYVIVKVILGFSATIGLVIFVYAGVTILISKGNPDGYKKGMNLIKYTFGGILIIIFSYAIVSFLTTTIPSVTGNTTANTTNTSTAASQTCSLGSSSSNVIKDSSSVSNCSLINNITPGVDCGNNLGKCVYAKQNFIDAEPGFLAADHIELDSTCGRSLGACTTYNNVKFCLRCLKNTHTSTEY